LAGDVAATLPADSVLIPLTSEGRLDGDPLASGSVWAVEGEVALAGPADLLVAYPGAALPSLLSLES
jgi:hypothetical protein